jgi:hypothetical protein
LDRWDIFLRAFREQVSKPSARYPAVRCWTKKNLVGVIASVLRAKTEELTSSTFFSAAAIIQRLENIGWIQRISIEPVPGITKAPELYFLDMEAAEDESLDPLEILQGYRPSGVLCYFGVLCYHELTTQVSPFFHIGLLQKQSSKPTLNPTVPPTPKTSAVPKEPNLLGTEVFRFQGTSCYTTRRNPALVPGIQTRIAGSRTLLRMTTLEQTLLDTLKYPQHCGGEEVVFEAWERGVVQWNADRLAEYLEKIDQLEFDRRVGAILETLDLKVDSAKLNARLESARARTAASNTEIRELPLLGNFSYPNLNNHWRVLVP